MKRGAYKSDPKTVWLLYYIIVKGYLNLPSYPDSQNLPEGSNLNPTFATGHLALYDRDHAPNLDTRVEVTSKYNPDSNF